MSVKSKHIKWDTSIEETVRKVYKDQTILKIQTCVYALGTLMIRQLQKNNFHLHRRDSNDVPKPLHYGLNLSAFLVCVPSGVTSLQLCTPKVVGV
jgi:hypothetical protein